jgi:hypothetical protein
VQYLLIILLLLQLKGQYQVKNERLKVYHNEAVKLLKGFDSYEVEHVRR